MKRERYSILIQWKLQWAVPLGMKSDTHLISRHVAFTARFLMLKRNVVENASKDSPLVDKTRVEWFDEASRKSKIWAMQQQAMRLPEYNRIAVAIDLALNSHIDCLKKDTWYVIHW